jgi:hypothetical protein
MLNPARLNTPVGVFLGYVNFMANIFFVQEIESGRDMIIEDDQEETAYSYRNA